MPGFTELVAGLESALRGPLPGASAQEILAPRPRREWPAGFTADRVRHAAGLLLLFPAGDRAYVVLTLRAEALRHGGQVSLPGGGVKPGETFEQAALREAHEEVGLAPDSVRVLGLLTPLDVAVSGFRLHPVVAASDIRPRLAPSDGEVARILEVELAELLDPSRLQRVERVRDGHLLEIPLFQVGGHEIWGVTAMALAEFLTLLGWRPDER